MKIFQFRSVAALLLITLLLFITAPAMAEEADPHPKLSLSLSLGKSEAYPGEAVPVTVTLRINDATVRNIGYPRLAAPNGKNIAFAPPVQESEAGATGVILHRFTGQISAVKPGTRIVGPARLDCEVMKSAAGSAAFFGGQEPEPLQLTSTAATVTVLPLPASGKPEHFSGAIGAFSLSVTSLPAQIVPGEPLTVTTTIRGIGSLAGTACPSITGPDLQSFPVRATRSASQLICEQVVVPNKEIQFPPVVWGFFNPEQRRYAVLSAEVDSRVVSRALNSQTAAPSPASASSQKLPARSDSLLMILGAVFALVAVGAFAVRKRKKLASETVCPNELSDVKKMLLAAEEAALHNDVELFYNIVFECIQNMESVGKHYNRFFVPAVTRENITRLLLCENTKKPYKQSDFDSFRALTIACDKVRYGRIIPNSTTISADFESFRQILSSRYKTHFQKSRM